MDLFAAAGIDTPSSGGRRSGRPTSIRTLRVPLFNHRVVEEARRRAIFEPSTAEIAAAAAYAKRARGPAFLKQKETAVRPILFRQVLGDVLGYTEVSDEAYTLRHEEAIRGGSADVALGRFGRPGVRDEIVAPLEAKGPTTGDLDAIPPGRRYSPVQQAWNYAIDNPGSQWVLVTNCVELRLYGFGRGRDAYESFDLSRLDERDEHERLWLFLAARRLLDGATDALLRDTDKQFKAITDDLYRDYKGLRDRLIQFLIDSADGPRLAGSVAIEQAQKTLDRILFVAFAQRTDLLPDGLLQRTEKASNPFAPKPIWDNFKGLFGYLNKGHFDLDITAYNGGLFAPDPVADALDLPASLVTDLVKLSEWDYRGDVPVTVLGHIFEQSITDLDRLRAESLGMPAPDEKTGKRKREGVVYTPDIITRFLVERTIGLTLSERFEALSAEHGDHEAALWTGYAAALRDLTIVDPACGSGAFLVAAFDLLAGEYRRVTLKLDELGAPLPAEFDAFDEILTRNLHGVDLNAESVEITRLSLWLKTARRRHKLQKLDATIKVGNSLIDDPAITDRPFDWRAAFPDVFARGGFDVVIGNPPYVRMEFLKAVKPYLAQHYVVAADRADLYAYFFERGVDVTKPSGRLGYISSSTFFRTGSGENLRTFLGDRVAVEAVVDFGDLQVFEGVTTYPAILTLRKGEAAGDDLRFLRSDDALPKDLSAAFSERSRPMPRARLGTGSWRFEDDALSRLRDKIAAGRKTLGEVYGPPMRGIVTGLNEAFVIDTPTRDRLVATDPRSADLLVPFLRGEDVKRWRVEPQGLFLINTPKGRVDIEAYPAIRDWLLPFRPDLEKRATKQAWWELQQAQVAYQGRLKATKICWPHFQHHASFTIDRSGSFLNNKCFFLASQDVALIAFLNSNVTWWQLRAIARPKRGAFLEAESQYVEDIFLPSIQDDDSNIAQLGNVSLFALKSQAEIETSVGRRIVDITSSEKRARLSRRLERWWDLSFSEFRVEVKRAYKADIPLKERGEWESYLAENAAEVKRLTAQIQAAEREINAIVYRAFDLTPDEIELIETSLEGQY